jgi:acetolactate synthase-1/2/3 large subunit
MPISTEKYRSTDISGDYAAMAQPLRLWRAGDKPEDIVPAIKRGMQKTQEGVPVLLEFITTRETEVSRPDGRPGRSLTLHLRKRSDNAGRGCIRNE